MSLNVAELSPYGDHMSTSRTIESPVVFLGSSIESLPELHIIEDALKSHARVTPWTNRSFFSVAGSYILDSLLQQVNAFDFAVFIFGADDLTTSRGIQQAAPRDNVIFETGLFMSYLGRERTLVVAPNEGTTHIKILSDFAGLQLVNYELPHDRAELWKKLKPACDEILKRIEELGARPLTETLPRPGPRDAMKAGQVLNDLFDESLREGNAIAIRNIALDMEFTWPIMKGILDRPDMQKLDWQTLMIDPTSEAIKNVASNTVNLDEARRNQREISKTFEEKKAELERRAIHFECRTYQSVPLMHGFLFDESVLFLTLCGMTSDGKLVGRPNPYWRFDKNPDSPATGYSFQVFNDWFTYHWNCGRQVWPL